MQIGKIIQQIREDKGLSRDEVVQRNGYFSYFSWSRVEQGRRQLAANEIEQVAIALGISNEELLKNPRGFDMYSSG